MRPFSPTEPREREEELDLNGAGASSASKRAQKGDQEHETLLKVDSAETVQQDVEDEYEDEDDTERWINAAVLDHDDVDTLAFTARAVVLGILWSVFLAVANALFSFRQNVFVVPPGLVLLLAYPMGVFLEKAIPSNFTVCGINWNPGRFSVKEHCLIFVMASSAGGLPYGIDNVVGQRYNMFMANRDVTFWNSLPWILATQFIGYGIAGISRKYLVKPKQMLWPSILPTVALLNSFHSSSTDGASKKYPLSKLQFFWLAFLLCFFYEWLPLYFTPVLTLIAIPCLFPSASRTLKFLSSGSYNEGVGLFGLSLDWSVLSGQQPLTTPFWAALNYFIGMIVWGWIAVPLVQYYNPFHVGGDTSLGYLAQSTLNWGGTNTTDTLTNRLLDPRPSINNAHIYSRNGSVITVKYPGLLLQDYSLNQTYYQQHAPFYLSAAFTVAYFVSFLNVAAVTMHVILWHGQEIYSQFRNSLVDKNGGSCGQDDFEDKDFLLASRRSGGTLTPSASHQRRMMVYMDVPDWIYILFLVIFSIVQLLSGILSPFRMPWWSTLFGIVLGSFYVVPIGIIQAISGFQMGLNVLTEFVIGLMTPGDTIGVMCFKSLGYNMVTQALSLLADLKLGYYLYISPISMFGAQLIGTLVGALFNLITALWAEEGLAFQFANDSSWNPQSTYGVFTNAGGIWGAVGPARFFGIGSPYVLLLWGFAIGLILPIIPFALNTVFPHRFWRSINFPLLTQTLPTSSNQAIIIIPFVVNFVFNKIIYKYKRQWWSKYNFILGIALDSSTAIAILVITLVQMWWTGAQTASFYNPKGSVDYYCLEQNFDGSSSVSIS